MENTFSETRDRAGQPALRNDVRPWMSRVKLALIWLAVLLPMIWGVMTTWDDVQYLLH